MNLRQAVLLLTILFAATLTGCAATVPAGRWEADNRVGQVFESATVLPHHTYYYLGSITAPDSVIAIDNRFTLRTRVWAGIEISEQILRNWLAWFPIAHSRNCLFRGGVIFTPDGQQAGVWYSPNIINLVQMPEPGVLVVFQPRSPGLSGCTEQEQGGIGLRFDD